MKKINYFFKEEIYNRHTRRKMKKITRIIANYFGINEKILKTDKKQRDISRCRQTIIVFISYICHVSLNYSGTSLFSMSSSGIVSYSRKSVKNLIETNNLYKQNFQNICELLKINYKDIYENLDYLE